MNKRKIILLIVSITTLILTVFTFSYAWFATNLTVYLTNLEIEVNAGKGLMISVDGVNYSSNITGSNIKKAIVAKYKNYEFKDGFLVDSDENLVNLSDDDINKIFSEIVLKPITSLDGKTFYKDKASLLETNASEGLYLNFDLYFKSLNDYTNVYFNSNDFSHFEDGSLLKKTSVTSNVIKTVNDDSKTNYLFTSLNTFDKVTGNIITYQKGDDTLEIKACDAMRFSVSDETDTKIYELNKGLGSYATTLDSSLYSISNLNLEASSLDANKNASFTYVNNLLNESSKFNALDYELVPVTYKDLNYVESGRICEYLKKDEVVKKTFNFWLEGFDADCFDTIISSKIFIDLAFTTNEAGLFEKLKTINYHIGDEVVTRTYYDYVDVSDIVLPYQKDKRFIGWVNEDNLDFNFSQVNKTINTQFDVYAKFD